MRNTFITMLTNYAKINDKIFLIVADLGYSVVEEFAELFPKRFINAGVAEQNMIGLAAGIASEGYHVFCYSIANFPTFRCAEQIRNDVSYHNFPVTIVAVGGGVAYGNLGYSHHAVQDYALMRTMPNLTILAPGDPNEVSNCMDYIINNPGPSYLRLGKTGELNFSNTTQTINDGQWNLVKEGKDNKRVIVSTGTALDNAIALRQKKYQGCAIYTVPVWSMKSKKKQFLNFERFNEIITVEDHLLDGGFGSWLLEARNQSDYDEKVKITTCYLDASVCGTVGSQKSLEMMSPKLNYE